MFFFLSIFRSIASFILGLVVFFGLLLFFLVSSVRDNFLSADFYKEQMSDNNVYERFYDEVLLDPEFEDETENLLGDFDVPREDIVTVAREILPPDYLQDQVEGALDGVIDYLNKDSDDPEVFIDLGPPLENVKPALFRYMDKRIDALDEIPVNTFEELQQEVEVLFRTVEEGKIPTAIPSIESPEVLATKYVDQQVAQLEVVTVTSDKEFEAELNDIYKTLSSGQLPTRVPSIESIPVPLRNAAFDAVLAALREDDTVPKESIRGLEEREDEIKDLLAQADVQSALAVASRPLIEPVVDLFIDDAYDRAVEELRKDGSISEEAFDGLKERKDAIKEHLGNGDLKEALKLGGRALATPLIDDAIEDIVEELDDQKCLDIIAEAAEAEEKGQTREEFLDDTDTLRDVIDRGGLGTVGAIVIIVVGSILMAIVQIPRMASGLRWPGMTLFLSGLVFLVIGLVAKSVLPGKFDNLLDRSDTGDIPPTMINIITDVLDSVGQDIAGGFVGPAITVMIIGGVLLAASFIVRQLRIPFLSR